MRQPRSIIFYAWALFAGLLALVAGMITFVLVGGARQRADLTDLSTKAQVAQLANLSMVDEFLGPSARRAPIRPPRNAGPPRAAGLPG